MEKIRKVTVCLKKAIQEIESVVLWTGRLDYKDGESPSELQGIILIYLHELSNTIRKHAQKEAIKWHSVNEWIGKVIFLRGLLLKVDFSEYKKSNTKGKEQALRELIVAEKLLIELRDNC